MDSGLPDCPDPPPARSPEKSPEAEVQGVVVGEEEQRWELVPSSKVVGADAPKVVGWEELQQELARLWSLSAALAKAKERKAALAARLESALEVRRESLEQINELEEMRQKLQTRDGFMGDLIMRMKKVSEDVDSQREQLCLNIRTLLVASKTLSGAHNKLQEASKLLSGENGHGRLKNLQKTLRMRQQYMVAQVANLYPVKSLNEQMPAEKLGLNSGGTKTRNAGSTLPNGSQNGQSSLAILGLQLSKLPIKKTSYFGDKTEVQKSATVLGYVAHAVYLIASYLDVPLRYPVQLGGSRSYILDYAPSVESSSVDLAINPILPSTSTSTRPTEFPLFFGGQDTTRATYAIFLLNKDLEQLLNYIGAESLGPRHVLANLKQLTRIIQSQQYICC